MEVKKRDFKSKKRVPLNDGVEIFEGIKIKIIFII